jgi:hypothetical protein
MFDVLSTREVATAIWLFVFIYFVFVNSKTKESAFQVVKIACSKQLATPFVIMILYAVILVISFAKLPIWKIAYIKDILIWVFFVGVPVCFGAVTRNVDSEYFKKIVLNNLKFAVIVEFFINTFTFSLIVELILIPILTFLFIFDAVPDTKEEYLPAKKLSSMLLPIIGFGVLGFAFKNAIYTYNNLGVADLLVKFFIPIVFSTFYIPVAYSFAIYSKYQMMFIRMSFREPKDKKVKLKHRLMVIKKCGLSYKKICMFEKEFANHMFVGMSTKEFHDLINKLQVAGKF